LKIIFAGTPEFAALSLSSIIEAGHNVIAVYTQPDRPAGRGKKILKSEVKRVAEKHAIAVYQPDNLRDPNAQDTLNNLSADLMIVAAYGLLLPTAVLTMPKFGCINIHASLLPRWRGAAPIQRAIQAGDSETGITLMLMDEGLDTGNILLKKKTEITLQDTGGSLHDRLAKLGSEAILEFLASFDSSAQLNLLNASEKQDDSLAVYAKKLTKQEAEINWDMSAHDICLMIRAFNPWPVAFINTQNLRIRIFEAEFVDYNSSNTLLAEKAATVLEKNKEGVLIKCGRNALRVLNLQLPGAKAMDVKSFVNGGKTLLNKGDILNSELS